MPSLGRVDRRSVLIATGAVVVVSALVAAAVVRGGHHDAAKDAKKGADGAGGTPKAAVTFKPGSAGVGDPYFPNLGNGGYDVGHYDLALAYEPSSHRLSGT